jgi:hypothetical protein
MTEIGADFNQLDKFNRKFLRFLPRWRRYHNEDIETVTTEAFELVRRNASGPPGPNVVSGQYLGSITKAEGRVFSNSPYGPRLEYGFTGQDSLGRNYHQQPRPHWRPMILEMRKRFPRQMKRTIIQVWKES